MLKSISISNLGLIEKTNLTFEDGFTVITGETGAGKSFFCKAIELSLGSRAKDKNKNSEIRTVVETVFGDHIFRRVLENGKSRFFIDDCPENLSAGQDFSKIHLDMHSQHENIFLRQKNAASVLLDASLANQEIVNNFHASFKEYKNHKKRLDEMRATIEKSSLEQEFLEFQQSKMKPINFELSDLEQAEKEVKNAEQFLEDKNSIDAAVELLAGETSVLSYLDEAEKYLRKLGLEERTIPLFHLIPDLVHELEKRRPNDLDDIEQSKKFLEKIRKLTREFSVISPEQLLEKKQNIDEKIESFHLLQSEEKEMSIKVDQLKKEAEAKAKILSEARRTNSNSFSEHIQKKCQEMGMPPARFEIQFEDTSLQNTGIESVAFFFSANKNQSLSLLSDVASGGEIARIMLALKHFWPSKSTMVFDEIDTGVSGAIAQKMGEEMQNLSKKKQIIAISHLPQIAAKADHHFVVEKTHNENSSATTLRKVEGTERIEMIAKMLSGDSMTDEALNAAKKLMTQN